MTLNEIGGSEGPYDDSADLANLDLSSGSGSGFLQSSMSRCLCMVLAFCKGDTLIPCLTFFGIHCIPDVMTCVVCRMAILIES